MKVLLCAINAKYIHTSFSVRSLAAYVRTKGQKAEIYESTVNIPIEKIVRGIVSGKPDVLCFSCYLWNIDYVGKIIHSVKKILPNTAIVLGGPEVSFEFEEWFEKGADVVVTGEGEHAFSQLISHYETGVPALSEIPGIADFDGNVRQTGGAYAVPLSDIPFVYDDLPSLANRILYYQTSRGCPFRCAYCLSENPEYERSVRYLSDERIFADLRIFLEARVRQVKLIDRTFNCNAERAERIWCFLIENDNGVTNFHFEISADLLVDSHFSLLAEARPALFQFEIGVQSDNPKTLSAVNRKTDNEILFRNIERLNRGNIHLHLDLIAGLPYEGLESFIHSFNRVYAANPEQLQLGFLKLLKGASLRASDDIVFSDYAPYEVLSTSWLSYGELCELKAVESVLDRYYNSGNFIYQIKYVEKFTGTPYNLYKRLAEYFDGFGEISHSLMNTYKILFDFASGVQGVDSCVLKNLAKLDMLCGESVRTFPEWLDGFTDVREAATAFFRSREKVNTFLPHLSEVNSKELAKRCVIESFDYDIPSLISGETVKKPSLLLFDYSIRDISGRARFYIIKQGV